MIDYHAIIGTHCRQFGLMIALSTDMPAGYETAFGTYVPETRTLHINASLLQGAPRADALFYLYHELRHAEQYQHPERFSEIIQQSLPYVILYNGICFKQIPSGWAKVQLDGDEAWFTRTYLSLPYELDANKYACEQLKREGLNNAAENLRQFWIPAEPLPEAEFLRLFQHIDNSIQ